MRVEDREPTTVETCLPLCLPLVGETVKVEAAHEGELVSNWQKETIVLVRPALGEDPIQATAVLLPVVRQPAKHPVDLRLVQPWIMVFIKP